MPRRSSRPCTRPSSPKRPCSALKHHVRALSSRAAPRADRGRHRSAVTSIAALLAAPARTPRRRPATPRARPTSRPSARRRAGSCAASSRSTVDADAPDLPFELDAAVLAHALGAPPRPAARSRRRVAPPVLIRKLQCFSETMAAPQPQAAAAGASISCQAFWPGGFLKVLPPVRDPERLRRLALGAGSRPCGPAIASARPASPRKRRAGDDPVRRQRATGDRRSPARLGQRDAARPGGRAPRPSTQPILGLAAEGAGIHAHATADPCRGCRSGTRARQARACAAWRDALVEAAGAGADQPLAVDVDLGQRRRRSRITTPVDAAVADQEVGGRRRSAVTGTSAGSAAQEMPRDRRHRPAGT